MLQWFGLIQCADWMSLLLCWHTPATIVQCCGFEAICTLLSADMDMTAKEQEQGAIGL